MTRGDEPAYPTAQCDECEHKKFGNKCADPAPGMTVRERFAMAAMQGLLANPDRCEWSLIELAKEAGYYTDKMLAELEKRDE